MAQLTAQRSTCSRLAVGAVIHKHGRILSVGYNGAPAGLPHCTHGDSNEPCTTAVHAEANAIVWAAREGIKLHGAELEVTHSPCPACALLIVQAGITAVTFKITYRNPAGINTLKSAGVVVISRWMR